MKRVLKIGSNRSSQRIWIEGKALETMGWTEGVRFEAHYQKEKKQLVFQRKDEGSRKVSGTTKRPIIDTNTNRIGSTIGQHFEFVSVEIKADEIIIAGAEKPESKLKSLVVKAGLTALAVATLAAPYVSRFKADAKKVLVGCEYSGTVRDEFSKLGHDAISCDILPTDSVEGWHIQDQLEPFLSEEWDLILGFPPCTYLCSSGLWRNNPKHDPEGIRSEKTRTAIEFAKLILAANAPEIAMENPVGCLSTQIRKPDQIIQPFNFGDSHSKRTCLWLKALPLLTPTNILDIKEHGYLAKNGTWLWMNQTLNVQSNVPPSKDRGHKRSKTYLGIAQAMAAQWGSQHAIVTQQEFKLA